MTTPHKHAALIKAWADGAQIEYLDSYGRWENAGSTPAWNPGVQYRVKAATIVRFAPVLQNPRGGVTVAYAVTSKEPAANAGNLYHKVRGILRIEINPDTLELVSATLEKP